MRTHTGKSLLQWCPFECNSELLLKTLCNIYNVTIFSSQDKEVRDVTELCDELLLKVQKHGF